MQMIVEKVAIIKKPVPEVWKAFCDVNAWSRIFPDVMEARIDGELRPGKTFYMKLKGTLPFIPMNVSPTVLKMEKEKLIRWRGSGKLGIKGIHDFTFEPFGKASTKIVSREVFSGRFIFLALILQSRVEKTFELHLEGLKYYLEGRK